MLETLVRHYRHATQAEELSREARQQAGRSVSYWFDMDGSLVIKGRLPALAGAMVVKALEAAMDEIPTTETAAEIGEEVRLSWQARRADALALMAQRSLHSRARTLNTADRYQVVVHVDAQTLRDRTARRACEIEHGTTLAVETVRRLTCDASLVRMLENSEGEPLDVGRKTRSIPPAIRRAIRARDAGCRFPGCTHQRYLDAHHVQHWADGGPTQLKNLVSLCRQHHRIISIERASYDGTELQRTHDRQGIRIDGDTAATLWRGERMDYDLGVLVLLQHAERARNVSAETSEQIF
jgi:5-methylcytosine-specific restriction endonuclease McrA